MTYDILRELIEAADRAITSEDFDGLMDFYADDATLVVRPGQNVTGKPQIREAFEKIASYFGNSLSVKQGRMKVLEGGDSALVIMETVLEIGGQDQPITRRATYVFRKSKTGEWLCTVDNSYGIEILDDAS